MTSPTSPTAEAIAQAERRIERLDEIARIGLNLARALLREAEAGPMAADLRSELAESYTRLSRDIRFAVAQANKAEEELCALRAEAASRVVPPGSGEAIRQARTKRHKLN